MNMSKTALGTPLALLTLLTSCLWGGNVKALEADKLPEDVRGILEKTAATYREAKTYSDAAVYKMVTQYGDVAMIQEMPWQLTFERPNKINARAFGTHLVIDGQKQFTHLTVVKEFKVGEAPKRLDPELLFLPGLAIMDGDPSMMVPLALLTEDDALTFLIDSADTVTKSADETVADRPCYTLQMRNAQEQRTYWIDKQSRLVLRCRSKAEIAKAGPGVSPSSGAIVEVDFPNARIGDAVDAATFAIPNPEGAEKVDRLRTEPPPGQAEFPSPLLGKQAPDFTLYDLEGKEVKLSSTAGKLVVLDFWATWCGPCIQAMPDMQKLYKKFGSKNVVVLGINTDQGGPKDRVAQIVRKNGVTFPTLLDGAGTVAGQYGVDKLPTVILLDKAGKVARFHLGGGPGKRQILSSEINDLLAK
jgi:peroxiredoxin